MKVIKLDRRYSMCRFNDYWIALEFQNKYDANPYRPYIIKCKLQDHYGPSGYAMVGNPCPWYNEYDHKYGGAYKETIYLRNESILTFLQLSGVLDESN